MALKPGRLDLEEEGNEFVLTRTTEDGEFHSIGLSVEDVLTLAQSGPLLRQRILERQPQGDGAISAVAATPVAETKAFLDALGETILLHLISPGGSHVVFELSPERSTELARSLVSRVSEVNSPAKKGN
jgi:hypothetical protein